MQLILDTETNVDIGSMTELKDNIREKLVNNIMEELNLSSSDKENIENPENVICKDTNKNDTKVVDDDNLPIIEIKQESVNIEMKDDTTKHEENLVESQNESNLNSSSPTANKESHKQCINDLKLILKQEVVDFINQDKNEEAEINVPDVDNIECKDSDVSMEEVKNVENIVNENESKRADSHDSESCNTNKSKTNAIELINEQVGNLIPKEIDDVPITENVVNNTTELNNSIDKPAVIEEPSSTTCNQPVSEEINQIRENTAQINEDKCIETVVIDDTDSSIKEVEKDNIKDSTNETSSTTDEIEDVTEITKNSIAGLTSATIDENKDEVVVVEEDPKETLPVNETSNKMSEENKTEPVVRKINSICRLSNTLDILSDDDEDPPKDEAPKTDSPKEPEKVEAANLDNEDDDDIMVIEEDSPSAARPKSEEHKNEEVKEALPEPAIPVNDDTSKIDEETGENKSSFMESIELVSNRGDKEPISTGAVTEEVRTEVNPEESKVKEAEIEKPLLPDNILNLSKKKLSDMSREELEEFCILKIVEGIMDRSQLSDTRAKLKSMMQNYDEQRSKISMLMKQNRELHVVLKSVQEEQKKVNETYNVVTPLKITRSVGMQVYLADKIGTKRKSTNPQAGRALKSPAQTPTRPQKPVANMNIPVPRLVPASNTGVRSPTTSVSSTTNGVGKSPTTPNGFKITPAPKVAEKRPFNRVQAVTVDLTDDEPPAKIQQRSSPAPPVRVVPSHNLLASPRPNATLSQMLTSPRKVFIPIGAQTAQNIRAGQNIIMKSVQPNGPKPRTMGINTIRPQNQVRGRTSSMNRHPAPLPDATKQYQPPNWKSLPPAPDLKLSKVENGIVISWKIDGYQEDLHEQIASYQLYAYQETSSPPSTTLWKKIGDVKALPLPMACTLTQFTAGFKYFFAVRAVDVRSRLGPFSLPGSILLLQKM